MTIEEPSATHHYEMTPQKHIAWTSKRIARDVSTLRGENIESRAETITQLYLYQLLDSLGVRIPSDEETGK